MVILNSILAYHYERKRRNQYLRYKNFIHSVIALLSFLDVLLFGLYLHYKLRLENAGKKTPFSSMTLVELLFAIYAQ